MWRKLTVMNIKNKNVPVHGFEIHVFPHKVFEHAELWATAKINATLKKQFASEVYQEKIKLSQESTRKFIEGVRNHSLARQHMGAFNVIGLDLEVKISSLIAMVIASGKFYNIQQQTGRAVKKDAVVSISPMMEEKDVKEDLNARFGFYWKLVADSHGLKFDKKVQAAYKVLPLCTETRLSGVFSLRTLKEYASLRTLSYLPPIVSSFAQNLHQHLLDVYPILADNRSRIIPSHMNYDLESLIKSDDLSEDRILYYNEHSFLFPTDSHAIKKHQDKIKLLNEQQPALLVDSFNLPERPIHEIIEDLRQRGLKAETTKTELESAYLAFLKKMDLSGLIDDMRHTRMNRVIQSIYQALDEKWEFHIPRIFHGTEFGEQILELSRNAVELYKDLVKNEGYQPKDVLDIIPHTFKLAYLEIGDLWSWLNYWGLRSCTSARPEVQKTAMATIKEAEKVLPGISTLTRAKNRLCYARIRGICNETTNTFEEKPCRIAGDNVIYIGR